MSFSRSQMEFIALLAMLTAGLLYFYAFSISFISLRKQTDPYHVFLLIKRKYLVSYTISYLLLVLIGYQRIGKIKKTRSFLSGLFYLIGSILFSCLCAFQLWFTDSVFEHKFRAPFAVAVIVGSTIIILQTAIFYYHSDKE